MVSKEGIMIAIVVLVLIGFTVSMAVQVGEARAEEAANKG